MTTPFTIHNWLTLLHRLIPATGLILVGGSGISTLSRYAELQIPSVLVFEGDEARADRLATLVQAYSGWAVKHTLVASHDGEATWYQASNPNENGLLPPEQLTVLWKNLSRTGSQKLTCLTVDTALKAHGGELYNWLVVDCLPGLSVLQGAEGQLQSADLVVVRSVAHDAALKDIGASQEEIEQFMSQYGYQLVASEEENQPAVAHLLYVRNWKQQAARLTVSHSTASKLAEERRLQLELLASEKAELTTSREEQSKLAVERQQQIEQLSKARDEQAKLAADRQAEASKLKAELQNTESAKKQLEAEKSQLTVSHSTASKLAEERRLQLELLASEKAELTASREEQSKLAVERQQQIEQLSKARDEQAKLAADRQAEISKLKVELQNTENAKKQLEAQMTELEHRQQLMNEEMVKAEGQIELIKDLLLREPGL